MGRSATSKLWGGARAQAIRAEFRPEVEAGWYVCPFCGLPIRPGQRWDVDHAVPLDVVGVEGLWDRSLMRPAHASCNRAAGARLANRKRGHRRRRVPVPRRVPCAGCADVLVSASEWMCAACAAVVAGDGSEGVA